MSPRTSRGKKSRQKSVIANAFGLLTVVSAIYFSAQYLLACDSSVKDVEIETPSTDAVELQKVATLNGLDEKIVEYKGMTVSFNPKLHIPNWVAWELTGEEADGTVPRYDKFMTDESVPGCPSTYDYSYSGYDRGHMAPAGDMKWDEEAMRQTFYMTNICPQAPDLNRGSWMRLEEKCRQRAHTDGSVIIVCGPVLTEELNEFIGDTRVAVPKRYFKVVLSPYREDPMAIGFIMPNGDVPGGMQTCAVSVDSVEALTGHDFFASLPDHIEKVIEAQCNFNRWSQTAK